MRTTARLPKNVEPAKQAGATGMKLGGTEVRSPARHDELAAIIDHCTSAKAMAEAGGDHFLAYMLAMTIEEAQSLLAVTPTQYGRTAEI